ncbi:MAG: hypothetical protein ACTS5A_01605 [Candidatus Hodgkinia cicadicola]
MKRGRVLRGGSAKRSWKMARAVGHGPVLTAEAARGLRGRVLNRGSAVAVWASSALWRGDLPRP